MEELKRLLGTLHTFHESFRHISPPCLTVLCFQLFSVCVTNTSLGQGNTEAGLHTASAMDKRDCPAGTKWDSLVTTCIGTDDAGVGVDKGPNLENVTPLFLIPNGRPKTETRPEPEKPTGEFH